MQEILLTVYILKALNIHFAKVPFICILSDFFYCNFMHVLLVILDYSWVPILMNLHVTDCEIHCYFLCASTLNQVCYCLILRNVLYPTCTAFTPVVRQLSVWSLVFFELFSLRGSKFMEKHKEEMNYNSKSNVLKLTNTNFKTYFDTCPCQVWQVT